MNLGGRSFGLRRNRPGDRPSAAAENQRILDLQQLANIRFLPPLFVRRDGTGTQVGVRPVANTDQVSYPCRVVEPLLNNEPMTPAQLDAPQEPARVTYRLRPDANASGAVPLGFDFQAALPVRYGRTFADPANVRVLVSRAGDLCRISASNAETPAIELEILREFAAVRSCQATSTTAQFGGGSDPAPTNPQVEFIRAGGTPSLPIAPENAEPSPAMPTMEATKYFSLAADTLLPQSDRFWCGDADYVTLSGMMQLDSIKGTWGLVAEVLWSPDGRNWAKAQMVDPAAGTKSDAQLTGDGFIIIDVRQGIGYVMLRWMTGGTPAASGTLCEFSWAKKRGTSNG